VPPGVRLSTPGTDHGSSAHGLYSRCPPGAPTSGGMVLARSWDSPRARTAARVDHSGRSPRSGCISLRKRESLACSILAPPAGFEPAHTAPECNPAYGRPPGRCAGLLAGHDGDTGRDRSRRAGRYRGGKGALAGVRHELRRGAGAGGPSAAAMRKAWKKSWPGCRIDSSAFVEKVSGSRLGCR
jgi:hypothetical protein